MNATIYTALLSEHHKLETYVDADDCSGLPEHLEGITRLDIGLNLPIPVLPLECQRGGLRAGLSFGRRKHDVFIPWEAIVAVRVDGVPVVPTLAGRVVEKTPGPVRNARVISREGNVIRANFGAAR